MTKEVPVKLKELSKEPKRKARHANDVDHERLETSPRDLTSGENRHSIWILTGLNGNTLLRCTRREVQLCNTGSFVIGRSVDTISASIGYEVTACVITTSGASLVERSCWRRCQPGRWARLGTFGGWRCATAAYGSSPTQSVFMLVSMSIPTSMKRGRCLRLSAPAEHREALLT